MLNIRDSNLCYKELKGKQNVDLKTGPIFISSIKGKKKALVDAVIVNIKTLEDFFLNDFCFDKLSLVV